MAKSQAQRNADAQVKLRRLGLPAGPLKGAEYRARIALGKARGLSKAQSYGKPAKGEVKAAVLKAAGQLRPNPRSTWKVPRPPKVVNLGDGRRQVTSTSKTALRQELRAAAKAGRTVTVKVTADGGAGPRTRIVGDYGGAAAYVAEGAELRRDEGRGAASGGSGAQLVGKVTLLVGDPDGFDAGELLDYLDGFDDWDDAWADLWDAAYEQ